MKTNDTTAIIMVDGGLCSQLVKYALGEFLRKKLQANVLYDTSWYSRCGMDCDGKHTRELLIHKLFPSIDFKIATDEEIRKYKKRSFNNKRPFEYCRKLLTKKLPMYVNGYYENITYMEEVKDILQRNIDFSHLALNDDNEKMLAKIRSEKRSCAVHVRRGDYINIGWAFLTPSYYVSSIMEICEVSDEPVHFFFFSNDMDYVRKHIIPLCPDIEYTLVDINTNDTGYLDLYLISQCWSQISSNSSFGFWGGFLNQHSDKVVVLPSKWQPQDSIIFQSTGHAAIAHYTAYSLLIDEYGNKQQIRDLKNILEHAAKVSCRKLKMALFWHNLAHLFQK